MNNPIRTSQERGQEISALKQKTQDLDRSEAARNGADGALLSSEQKFMSMFNADPIPKIIARIKDERYIEMNDAFQQIWGFDRGEVVGHSVMDVGIWRNAEQWEYVSRLFQSQGKISDLECRLHTKSGTERSILLSAAPVEADGQSCVLLITVDVTALEQTLEALRRANAYNQGLMEARLDPLVVIGPDNMIVDANLAAERITGCTRAEIIGTDFSDYFLDPGKARAAYRQAFHEGIVRDCPLDLAHRHGHVAPVLYSASTCWSEDGRFIGVMAVVHDITQHKQAEARLRESEERYRIAIEHSNDGVSIVRGDRHLYVNQKFLNMFGYASADDILGDTAHKEVHPDDRHLVVEYAQRRISGEPAPSRYTYKGIKKDGTVIFIEASVASITYHGKAASLAYLRDITERRQMEERLRTMSIIDELTGLYNRRGFLTLAQRELDRAERAKNGMDLFFIDLDGMKSINDTLGHKEGDAALVEVATVLRSTFRKSDIIGRMGGDEFAVLALDGAKRHSKEDPVRRLRDTLDNHNGSGTRKYKLSLSVGTVSYDPERPAALDELIAGADALMYEEKRRKKNRGGQRQDGDVLR